MATENTASSVSDVDVDFDDEETGVDIKTNVVQPVQSVSSAGGVIEKHSADALVNTPENSDKDKEKTVSETGGCSASFKKTMNCESNESGNWQFFNNFNFFVLFLIERKMFQTLNFMYGKGNF